MEGDEKALNRTYYLAFLYFVRHPVRYPRLKTLINSHKRRTLLYNVCDDRTNILAIKVRA